MRFIARITNHFFQFENEQYVRQNLSKLEGKKVVVEVEATRGGVSDALRGYYYAAVLPTVKATVPEWHNVKDDDLHEILKKIFNGFNFFNPFTKRTERVGRSAMNWNESNSARAMAYIDKIGQWLLEEYLVELPNPQEYRKWADQARLK